MKLYATSIPQHEAKLGNCCIRHHRAKTGKLYAKAEILAMTVFNE